MTMDIKGVLGIGPRALNKDNILGPDGKKQGEAVPTVLDNLKKQKRIAAKILCINFDLPSERSEGSEGTSDSSSVSSGYLGEIDGSLHFGGAKEGMYNPATLKIIPVTKRGISQHYYGIDLTLNYQGKTIMDNMPGVIDSGSAYIWL